MDVITYSLIIRDDQGEWTRIMESDRLSVIETAAEQFAGTATEFRVVEHYSPLH